MRRTRAFDHGTGTSPWLERLWLKRKSGRLGREGRETRGRSLYLVQMMSVHAGIRLILLQKIFQRPGVATCRYSTCQWEPMSDSKCNAHQKYKSDRNVRPERHLVYRPNHNSQGDPRRTATNRTQRQTRCGDRVCVKGVTLLVQDLWSSCGVEIFSHVHTMIV
jgi:hypothetical protein